MWKVIEFGDSYVVPANTTTTDTTSDKKSGRTVTLTAEDMQRKKNDVKARTTLLLSLPDEHQLRFSNKYKTARELWAAILKTFGANEATKKTKKNLLKQQYGNFKPEGSKNLEQTFTRLQVIIGQLSDLDTISLDDLYNHLKVYESKVQKKSEPNSQNMAFISSAKHSSENEDGNTDWSYMANNEEDHALVADEVAPTEFALMANTSAESKVFDKSLCSKDCKKNNNSLNSKITDLTDKLFDANNYIYHYKLALAQVESRLVEYKEIEVKYIEKIRTLEFYNDFNKECIEILKKKLETLKQEKKRVDGKLAGLLIASKDLDNLIESQRSDKNKDGLGYTAVPPPPAQLYLSPKKDLSWTGLPECADNTVTDYSRPLPTVESTSEDDQNRNPSVSENVASPITPKPFIKKRVKKNFTPRPVARKPYRPSQRPVRTNMNDARPNRTFFNKQAHSYANRPVHRTSAVRSPYRGPWVPTVNRNYPPVNRKFSTGSRNFPTANRKFPTASRKFATVSTKSSTADMGRKRKAVKPSACWFWRPLQNLSNKGSSQNKIDDKGYWDSGCSRHMTGNISYLSDYESFNGGYVSFGQEGCKIIEKGTIKTGKLEFENVYFVKDLKYNLFSLSQICDNKNSVLFTNSECIVLGKDFKLLDDANILLRTHRHHNMYSIDLNNIVPHRDLTCLVAKASADECMLWHRRLGKQHKASCKSKLVNSVTKPIHTLHMDLFGLTFDETSGILKKFITEIKNLKDLKVKIISTEVPEGNGNPNPTASTSNPPADQMETLTVETSIPTVSLPVLTAYSTDSQEPSSDARLISKRVANQEETPSLDNILSLTNRFEDILGGTTNSDESNGEEADISNMETAITASPTPTLKIHKTIPKNVWTLVDCPKGVRPIGTKWVLKNKKDERVFVIINKARLVAQGHTQEEGIDYDEVFTHVLRIEAIRLFLAYASFMGFTDPEFAAKVYKVEKAMYRLHQAPRAWYGTLLKYLLKNGFQRGTIDQTLFIRKQRKDFILVQVYVDDIIFGSSNLQLCREFEALMHEKFQMSAMGELNFFLGLQVLQKEDGIFLLQDKYVGNILKKFGYSDVRSSNTPMDKENPWGKDETRKDVDLYLYRSMIGSLMYLTTSRPDIMFVVCAYARHQVTPKECHLHAFKRIFRYLKGHPKLRIWYPKESPFDLVAYSDSDYGGATQDRKSTTGGCQFLGRRFSMPCKALSKEFSLSILRLLHTGKTFDLVWIWLGGEYGNVFLMGFHGIQWASTTSIFILWWISLRHPLAVPTTYSTDSQEPSSDARLISKRVANQEETPSLDNILTLKNRFEDTLGVSLNSEESNGVEADISNMETAITASPILHSEFIRTIPKVR
nr:hypothetical protein [Tanacetum cinerariifolium]